MATNLALAHATASAALAPQLTVAEAVAQFIRTKPLGSRGRCIILAMLFVAAFARALAPYDPYRRRLRRLQFARPSAEHWFGTDEFGRDVLSRIMYGARIALFVGFTGVVRGLHDRRPAGRDQRRTAGGKVDLLLGAADGHPAGLPAADPGARPSRSILGPSVQNVVIAISIPVIPRVARVVRSTALSVKENAVRRGRAGSGASRRRVILQHIVPNVMAPYIIMLTAQLGAAPSWPRRPCPTWAWARRSRHRRGA